MRETQMCKLCGAVMEKNLIGEHYLWSDCCPNLIKKVEELKIEMIRQSENLNAEIDRYKLSMEQDLEDHKKMVVSFTSQIEELKKRITRECELSDKLYLLLVDDPNTKLLADQIIDNAGVMK